MWHKMLYRVQGVSTAWRYANTELYSNANEKPEDISYKEYLNVIIDSYDHDSKNTLKRNINQYINLHKKKSSQSIPAEDPHPLSGMSWKFLCRVAIRGDFKKRQSSNLISLAVRRREQLGITEAEAIKVYS